MKTLIYNVPVYVGVNDDGTIAHVVIDDTSPLSEGDPRLCEVDETGDADVDAAELARLIETAKSADWPAWKFGF